MLIIEGRSSSIGSGSRSGFILISRIAHHGGVLNRGFGDHKSSPACLGGVAAASADGVVVK
jgi:hypothetical protein